MSRLNHDEQALFDDWKGFLVADRPDLRLAATEAVLHVVSTRAAQLVQQGMVPLLAKNCTYETESSHPGVSVNALQALVYLTSHGPSANQCVQDLQDAGGLNRMLEIALSRAPAANNADRSRRKAWRQRVNYALSIMANLTRTEEGAVALVGRTLPEQAVPSSTTTATKANEQGDDVVAPLLLPTKPTMELLLARFLSSAYLDQDHSGSTITTYDTSDYYEDLRQQGGEAALDSHDADPYQHFAAVLLNATQTEQGRRFLLQLKQPKQQTSSSSCTANTNTTTTSSSNLQSILTQLRSPNPIRRRGIAGTIRNCCLEARDSAWWFLHVVKITTHLLYPLAGPEELDVDDKQGLDPDLWLEGPDKKREPDHATRLFLVEALLLLCASGRASRETLRLQRAYVILKWADMVEEHEDVSEQIFDCVNFLRRDEDGTQEGSSDKLVAEAYSRKPSAARQIGAGGTGGDGDDDDDFDDVD